jgi:hypothetical protein
MDLLKRENVRGNNKRSLRKKCRVLPAGGLGVSPSFNKPPKIGGDRGLIEIIPAVLLRVD